MLENTITATPRQWVLNNTETPRTIFHSFSLLCLVRWSLSSSSNGAPWLGRGPVSLFSSLLSPFYLPPSSHTRWVSSSKWRIIFLHSQKLYLMRTQIWFFWKLVFEQIMISESSQLSWDSCAPSKCSEGNFGWNFPPTKIYISTKFREISSVGELNWGQVPSSPP